MAERISDQDHVRDLLCCYVTTLLSNASRAADPRKSRLNRGFLHRGKTRKIVKSSDKIRFCVEHSTHSAQQNWRKLAEVHGKWRRGWRFCGNSRFRGKMAVESCSPRLQTSFRQTLSDASQQHSFCVCHLSTAQNLIILHPDSSRFSKPFMISPTINHISSL